MATRWGIESSYMKDWKIWDSNEISYTSKNVNKDKFHEGQLSICTKVFPMAHLFT